MKFITNILFNLMFWWLPDRKTNIGVDNCGVGVTMLLRHNDVKMATFCLSSFFYFLGNNLQVFVIDDGTLTRSDMNFLNSFFTVIFLDKKNAHKRLKKILKEYPNLNKFRFSNATNILKRKLIDATLLHPFDRAILMDADMIFFDSPKEIITWVKSPKDTVLYVAHDYIENGEEEDSEIIVRKLLYKIFPSDVDLYMSSGLVCLPTKKTMDLLKLEKIITYFMKLKLDKRYLVEQHIFTLILGKIKNKLLDKKKYLNIWWLRQYYLGLPKEKIFLHYAYEVKNVYKRDAIMVCWKNRFFKY